MLAIARREGEVAYCDDPDCFREAERVETEDGRRFCALHRKRAQRASRGHSPRYETPLGRAFEASLALRDFPSDGERDPEFTRAYDRWRKAIEAVARTLSPGVRTLRPR